MKNCCKIFSSLLSLLFSVNNYSFSHEGQKAFEDKDGFFFYMGVYSPGKSINLVWDEITSKPVQKYVVERSTDGQTFVPVIAQSAKSKPRDVRDMSQLEQETLDYMDKVLYTTEAAGHGRFIFNELLPKNLIEENAALKELVNPNAKWNDETLEELSSKIASDHPLMYRIKFVYADGTFSYSGTRSLSAYLTLIFQNALAKAAEEKAQKTFDKNNLPLWQTLVNNQGSPNTNKSTHDSLHPLAACPPVNLPSCVKATGNWTLTYGTCCNYKQEEYLSEQPGGTPCSLSNNGLGYCTPLINDCAPGQPSSDPCCAGGGCTHYPLCGCKPWECCTYTQPPVWYVTQSNSMTPPSASASSTSNPCSAGNSATASVSGGTGPYTYSWNPGGYTSSTITNVPPGNYTVTVTDTYGCTSVATVNIPAPNPLPNASFTYNTVCLGGTTNFTNTSTISSGSITGNSWNFGNGNTSTAVNPSQTYTASGTYSVTLTVTSNSGCVSTVTNVVTVNPQPVANFSPTTVCLGNATQFTNSSTGGNSWSWNFGDGNTSTAQNPSHTYSAAGNYTATLTVTATGGCTATISVPVTVNPQPTSAFSGQNVCLGNPTNFTDQSTGGANSWSWNFGDGNTSTSQNPSHTYTATGNYNVTLNVTTNPGGCTSSIVQVVTVYPSPVANFSATTVCLGNATQFTDQSTGGATSWSWNFGDGNTSTQQSPSHNYAAAGNYTVTLTVSSTGTCSSTFPVVVTVNPQPAAAISATTVCLGNPTQFTDNSTGGGNSWSWNFGDGNTSTSQNPSHTYTASGTYNVTMNVVANPGGCNSNATLNVIVNPQPVPDFSSTTICVGNATQFTDLSTGGGNSWSWNFGDGNTSTSQNPSHTYSAAGNYVTTLTVTAMPSGCTAVVSHSVTVFGLPVAAFTAPAICINSPPTNFTDQSTGASAWNWDFGDPASGPNNTSAQQNPSHTYSAPGNYTVTLIISSGSGCADTVTNIIIVNPKPTAAFSATTACFNNATVFTDQSTGGATAWSWNFGDPNSSSNTSINQNPSHTYSSAGSYSVTLTITNSFGCKDSIEKDITVNPLPQASFSAPAVCVGNTTCFSDLTTISSGNITGWSWNFGDPSSGNNISNLQNPCHLFSGAGTFNVVLTATSNNGCQSNTNMQVTVNATPVAAFTAGNVCLNAPTFFTNNSTNSTTWYWDFGDGGTSMLQNPTHIYVGYGNYVVTLIVSSNAGCKDTLIDTLTVYPLPVVNFLADSVCLGDTTHFGDLTIIPSGNAVSWSWDFGDGIFLSGQNPTHIYTKPGTYLVTLTVTSDHGCISNVTLPVKVFPLPNANFSYSPASPIHLTDMTSFKDLSTGGPVQWNWWFGDDSTSSEQSPSHLYNDTGTFIVTLAIMDAHGCKDTVREPVEILDYTFYIPNAFTPNNDGKNEFFFGEGIGIKEYEMWIFDRWGNRIYYCHVDGLPQQPGCWWNGKVDGGYSNEIVQQDVYVWKVHLTSVFDKTYDYVGTVTVVK